MHLLANSQYGYIWHENCEYSKEPLNEENGDIIISLEQLVSKLGINGNECLENVRIEI